MNANLAISFLSLTLILAGCASGPVGPAKKLGISTVKVEPRVTVKTALRYGPSSSGNWASLILNAMRSKEMRAIASLMQTNGIHVDALLHGSFVGVLHENDYFSINETNAQATFLLQIDEYGFAPDLFSGVYPYLIIRGELLTPNGDRVWSGRSEHGLYVRRRIAVPSLSDYERKPELLRLAWETQIQAAVEDLLRLKKKPATKQQQLQAAQ